MNPVIRLEGIHYSYSQGLRNREFMANFKKKHNRLVVPLEAILLRAPTGGPKLNFMFALNVDVF